MWPLFQHQPLYEEERDADITKHWSAKKGDTTQIWENISSKGKFLYSTSSVLLMRNLNNPPNLSYQDQNVDILKYL